MMLGVWMISLFGMSAGVVSAAAPGSVVINEVAWAGSADSGSDEWIELYNTTGSDVDLTGWTIDDDNGAAVYALSGMVPAHGYFVIEDSEAAVQPASAGLVVNMSLANSGDALVLKDDLGGVIDTVNGSGGAWFAGDSGTFATMERVDALVSGDDAGNWGNSTGGTGATASAGATIIGTPGTLNSVSGGAQQTGTAVSLEVSNPTPQVGETVSVSITATDVTDLFSYGFEIDYDPAVLSLDGVAVGEFLSESGMVSTSFQSGLENGQEGMLLLAEARTIDPKTGVSGTGELVTIMFDVIGGSGTTNIGFAQQSFLADTTGFIGTDFADASLEVQESQPDPVLNLQATEGNDRYTIGLSWDAVAGADNYNVYRKDAHGGWTLMGNTAVLTFVDEDGVTNGGNIVPFVQYEYQVTALVDGNESDPTLVTGMETRGLTGDNDRSDRVDGVDLDRLARHFAQIDGDTGFDALVDTTYDGMIDGSDLIDLGANFALTYQP